MKKVTIERPEGIGVLTKAQDGKWDICLNGQIAPSHYTQDQVVKIIKDMTAKGFKVAVE